LGTSYVVLEFLDDLRRWWLLDLDDLEDDADEVDEIDWEDNERVFMFSLLLFINGDNNDIGVVGVDFGEADNKGDVVVLLLIDDFIIGVLLILLFWLLLTATIGISWILLLFKLLLLSFHSGE